MAPLSRPRREADVLLLAAGPIHRDELRVFIAGFVPTGQSARTAASRRKREEDPRHKDVYRVGAKSVASSIICNALRYGVWVREGDMIRHRDWAAPAPPVAPVAPVAPVPVFTIPTLAELEGFARLASGSDWERASIVATFVVQPGQGHRSDLVKSDEVLTPEGFAALGFAGLHSPNSIRRYWRAWMDAVGTRPEPGQAVELPTIPFPRVAKARPETPTPPTQSNDPIEWAAWMRKNKSPKFIAQLAAALADDGRATTPERQVAASRTRTRTRAGSLLRVVPA